MSFPETRRTLIQRIAESSSESDWRQFLNDYWGPVCRFAAWRGKLSHSDAEDVASQTFEALLKNRLLSRWSSHRTARLRTMLCAVVRNVLSNRARVRQGREQLLRQQAQEGGQGAWQKGEATDEQTDAFYNAWVEDLLVQSAEALLTELHQEGKGDYFRVLYGRVCEGMKTREIADALGIKVTSAENFFKSARKRLAARLENSVREHVSRYCTENEVEDEVQLEWQRLADHLNTFGGLEAALKGAYGTEDYDPDRLAHRPALIEQTLSRAFSSQEASQDSKRG